MLTTEDDDHEQRILFTDFGITRNVGDISGLTATNMTVGTVAYSAPEQLMGEQLDGRADQYARLLGIPRMRSHESWSDHFCAGDDKHG
jgi:serine/threonine protein kinase